MSQPSPEIEHLHLEVDGERLHVAAWLPAGEIKAVALLLHGSLANGRIFYSLSGRGLAPFLARHGIACYVPDLRGRGRSLPTLSRHSRHGQWETVAIDIPALHGWVRQRHPQLPMRWLGHSWGGVMMVAAMARWPQLATEVRSLALLASKRTLLQRSLSYHLQVNLIPDYLCCAATLPKSAATLQHTDLLRN
ncbi:MAG: alpha/beta fold hydrolase [Gammaproteobacteria bacterium]|nr:alpha/beta fold hydrolase [Gammaproteobacteria bacterium]